jgi:oligopeptide/dipeptide ABC transporter ATP-binding protein
VLITHDMGVIAARASRVMVMYAGRIVEAAPTTELFARTEHPYAEALLRAIPRLDQDRTKPLLAIPGLPPDLSHPIPGCRFAPRCRYATSECTTLDPVLAIGDGAASPSVDATHPPSGGGVGDPMDHKYACFHPVGRAEGDAVGAPARTVTPAERDDVVGVRPILLALEGVTKRYEIHAGAFSLRRTGALQAVTDVSFTVREGETFGLVGESGCGKTTIGRMIVALERPSAGTISFDGTDIATEHGSSLRRVRRDLQLMFQDPYASLDPRMRVETILREPLQIQHAGDRAAQHARVAELLGEVGLPTSAGGLYPHEFSGGQRQRIGLARALALSPRLIVADEPVSALDVSIQAQILNLMRALQERHGLTYLVISHDLAVVRYVADTIGVMYLGKLVETGPSEAIYDHPAHPYTRALLDAIPTPNPENAAGARLAARIRGELPSAIDPPSGCHFRTRCPLAQEICAAEEPPMRTFGDGHLAACHFPLVAPVEEPRVGATVT